MASQDNEAVLARVATGVPGLDKVLKGGFFEGGIYIIQGDPGSGKTILANQICFSHLKENGRAVYATLLSESHSRLMQQLRTLSFFDEEALPDRMAYLSALSALEDRGLTGLLDLLRREIVARRATMLVIDGFLAAEASSASEREFKKFVHELQSHAISAGCTILLLTNGVNRPARPERTMVDGILMLSRRDVGVRSEREIEVMKLRASDYLQGRHSYEIAADGLKVYPRLESFYSRPSRAEAFTGARVSSGSESLDKLMGGGVPAASTTVVFGAPGIGKTTLGLHWAAEDAEAPSLFFGFFESPERLLYKADRLGLNLRTKIERGKAEIIWQPATEHNFDELGERLLAAIDRLGASRVVIDGLGGFMASTASPDRISRYFAALSNELRARGVNTLYTTESRQVIAAPVELPIDNISSLVENLLFFRFVEIHSSIHRLVSVIKMRDSDFDSALREFRISGDGLSVMENRFSTEGLMTGIAREPAGG
ncbi:RAD55 family ATPase [Terrihabitans sp. B22-R8]|uniref:RAD55 family ATPase n=1 Tax=Terrihabitans sp. B22-R8 TaxID=3425128 RepID=UPI00403CAD82